MNTSTKNPKLRVTVPAGTYWVGDPCYTIADADWSGWLDAADYTNPSREHVLAAAWRSRHAVGVPTAFGDGTYFDQDGREYPVDAGLIGLVPVESAPAGGGTKTSGKHRVTFDKPVECWHDAETGAIHLGHIVIETSDIGLEDEEDEWDEDEDL